MRADVVVVGAGPAGLATATRLAEAGRRVRVIARGNGFTHWGAGSVDVLGRVNGRRLERPGDGIGELPPQHPYRLLGAAPLRSGLEWFQRTAADFGLDQVGEPDANRRQVTGLGTLRTTCLLPAPAAGDLGGQIAVVGFDGYRDFSAALCGAGLERRAMREGLNGAKITTGTVELPEWRHQRYFTAIELAQAIDDEGFRSKLAPGLARSAAGAATAIVPAVLGLREGHKAWADLERRTGLRLVEAAIPPPSVPGLRLFNAYRQRLTGLDARWQFGFPAIAVVGVGDRITAVRCEGAAREITVECEDLVLATGGVAGHGIEARRDGSMVEVVAGLPVAGFPDRSGFVAERFLGEHPVAAAGVRVDDQLRPVNASGAPIYTNLRCVGGLLSDHDPTSEGSREGVALASASRVAELLAPTTASATAGNGGSAR